MNRKVSFFVIFLLIMISCGEETEQTISETTTSTILDTTSTSLSTTTTIVEINEDNKQKCPEDDNSNIDFSKTKNREKSPDPLSPFAILKSIKIKK